MEHHLSDEERARIGLQVDYFVEAMSRRYGLQPNEVIDAVRWVQQHRDFVSKLRHGGLLGILSTILLGVLLSIWEGIKAMIGRPQ